MLNKKMLMSILTLGILAIVASAGTFAYYSSSVPVSSTEFTTGKADLKVINLFYNYPPTLVPMAAVNAIPGASNARLTPIPSYATNAGSIDGVLSLKVVPSADDDGSLSQYLVIKATTSPVAGSGTKFVTLWDGASGSTGTQKLCDLDIGKSEYVYFVYSFPDNGKPQDDAQGKTFKFNVEYSLKQK